MVDSDGSFRFSPIRNVRFSHDGDMGVSIFPNPAINEIWVKPGGWKAGENWLINIIDQFGRVVFSEEEELTETGFLLIVRHLPKGLYHIKIENEHHAEILTFLKK